MGRSVKKGPYVEPSLLVKITALNEKNEKKVFKTWSRRSTITPDFVGHTLAVHNGNKFIPVYITEDRKSTRLNSSHDQISYAVFCLKKKKRHYNIVIAEALRIITLDNRRSHDPSTLIPTITTPSIAMTTHGAKQSITHVHSVNANAAQQLTGHETYAVRPLSLGVPLQQLYPTHDVRGTPIALTQLSFFCFRLIFTLIEHPYDVCFFFLNNTPPPEISTFPQHAALPI